MSGSGKRPRASAGRRGAGALLALAGGAAALGSCGSPEDHAKDAVRLELEDRAEIRFGRYTLVTRDRACLAFTARAPGGWYGPERQAVIRKAETHGENRKWAVEAMFDERHDQCVARLAAGPPAPAEEPTGSAVPLLAAADPARGEQAFRKCAACHTIAEGGPDGLGSNLWGIMGAPIAGRSGYDYSPALRAKGGSWTWEAMDSWLASPRHFAPGTKMTFAGIRTARDRADLLAYLNREGDRPLPLP